ncbi:MAG: TatD family hydrolase [Candidatus Hodarchaeota archaeon]
MYIDCHAHIFFTPIPSEAIEKDIIGEIPSPTMNFISRMISNANKKGVDYIVGIISNPNDFPWYRKQLELKNIINVIGIQRRKALEDHSYLMSLLKKEIERKMPHAIGEIGLDYVYGFERLGGHEKNTIKKKQQKLFRKQIRLAKELDLPIVVHAGYRNDKDIVEVLKQEKTQDVGGQIHGYMSDVELVSELLEMGFYFSFGYNHSREEELKRIVKITPLEQILTETDAPFHLMETPKRFILPEDIILINEEIARLKEIDLETFTLQIMRNARDLFKF